MIGSDEGVIGGIVERKLHSLSPLKKVSSRLMCHAETARIKKRDYGDRNRLGQRIYISCVSDLISTHIVEVTKQDPLLVLVSVWFSHFNHVTSPLVRQYRQFARQVHFVESIRALGDQQQDHARAENGPQKLIWMFG